MMSSASYREYWARNGIAALALICWIKQETDDPIDLRHPRILREIHTLSKPFSPIKSLLKS